MLGASVLGNTHTHTRDTERERKSRKTQYLRAAMIQTERDVMDGICVCRSSVNTFSSMKHTRWWEGPRNARMTTSQAMAQHTVSSINFWIPYSFCVQSM